MQRSSLNQQSDAAALRHVTENILLEASKVAAECRSLLAETRKVQADVAHMHSLMTKECGIMQSIHATLHDLSTTLSLVVAKKVQKPRNLKIHIPTTSPSIESEWTNVFE